MPESCASHQGSQLVWTFHSAAGPSRSSKPRSSACSLRWQGGRQLLAISQATSSGSSSGLNNRSMTSCRPPTRFGSQASAPASDTQLSLQCTESLSRVCRRCRWNLKSMGGGPGSASGEEQQHSSWSRATRKQNRQRQALKDAAGGELCAPPPLRPCCSANCRVSERMRQARCVWLLLCTEVGLLQLLTPLSCADERPADRGWCRRRPREAPPSTGLCVAMIK